MEGGAGPAMPPQSNRRRSTLEISSEHNFYLTTKVDIMPVADAPLELCTGYHQLLSALKESDVTFVFLSVIPLTTESAIVDPDMILTRMSMLMRHFTSTSRIKGKRVLCGRRSGLVSTEILRL